MNQVIITHKDGTTLPLFSRERVSAVSKATQKVALLSDDVVTLTVTTATPLDLQIGDTALIFGKTYKLNQLPEPTKDGNRKLTYEIRLEGLLYDLIDVHYHLPEDAYGETFYADLAEHLRVLMWNIERIYPGKWVLTECPTGTDYKNITTSEKNCLQVLQELCESYGVEFAVTTTDGITNKLTVKTQVGETHAFTLEFGRGKGLYQLSRKNVNNAGVTTRIYFYGGSENLGSNYTQAKGHSKLCLPGTTRLTSYLEDKAAIALYGVKEGEKNYSDIIPEYKSKVTGMGEDVNIFVDAYMFDLNEKKDGKTTYLIDGTSAKVKFVTGQLAGYSFDVHSYDTETHTFVINKFTDENGVVFPSSETAAFQIGTGDEYVLYDIMPPESKLAEAEQKLLAKAQEYLPTVSQPQVSYGLSLTEGFFIALWGKDVSTEVLHVGDYLHVIDTQIGIDKNVRITEISRNVLKRHSYEITLSDTVTKSNTVRVLNNLQSINETIALNGLADPSKARRRWKATQELLNMVFDPDGDYYSEKIKPLSIETAMLAVGAKSQQFTLLNVTLQANYGGDANTILLSSGLLAHYAIEDNLRTWRMEASTASGLTSSTAYYIYARCSRNDNYGVWVLSENAITVDSDPLYYYFLVGVLNSVTKDDDGSRAARLVSLTYGSSTINGRFVKTGRIESNAGSCWFDLDNNEIGGVIKFVNNDGGTQNVADIADAAEEAKDYINNTLPGVIDDLTAQIDGQIEQWFYDYEPDNDTEPTAGWIAADLEAGNDNEKEKHTGDLFYNTETGSVYRYVRLQTTPRAGGGYYWQWQQLNDEAAAKALKAAQDAAELAGTKRRIFVTQPVTPYDVGDLWVQGTDGDIMRCTTARATGNYTASDWEKASKYTDDSALTTFINGAFAETVSQAQALIDGKVECWYTSTDPHGTAGWTGLDITHDGDLWYNIEDNTLFRFVYRNGGRYNWEQIHDKEALEAHEKASEAITAADGKRTVFVETPYPPYKVGDLWLREYTDNGVDKKELWRCVTAKEASETYLASDWAEAVYYDNTQTTIDGGIVTAGTVQLANGTSESIVAGITGGETETATTEDEKKVRIWAGASKANRFNAPFRVLQNGKVVASNAEIEGTVKATDGEFNGMVKINGGTILLNKDGSGQLANGKVSWDSKGNVTLKDLSAQDINVNGGTFNGTIKANQGISYKVSTQSTKTKTLSASDVAVLVNWRVSASDETAYLYLPTVPNAGQVVTVINNREGWTNIYGTSYPIKYGYDHQLSDTSIELYRRRTLQLLFTGSMWIVISEYEW